LLVEKIFEAAVLCSILKQIFFKLIRDIYFTDSLIFTEPSNIIVTNIGARVILFAQTSHSPRGEINLLRKLQIVVNLHVHHLVVVKLEAFEIDDHRLLHILNEIASLRINQSLVLVALVLVFALEHLWFHIEVQSFFQGLFIFYV